ncbi:selenium cofactor biosynthesis protein YqeC [Cedecea neteri]|uniref:Putative selenium-dependent hydroxylase accessory protein YqeC n=1 Tax=Cedecea neteri TaxID=158822 RepID=A0A291DY73_9ENTR|nr:selenium cofactor biosynthesis protein YqeC [Cedecea neteri]ATF92576.1 putative selenium-dependent hydroxylase accessory protein YqeC [Cedecea neteri]
MENIPQLDTLFCDLNVTANPLLISAVGAGGKTSTLLWLARAFQQAGRRVLLTTTTHMYLPQHLPVTFCRDPLALPSEVWQSPLQACFSAWLPEVGKAKGFTPAQLDDLLTARNVDVVLVEADGAHGFAIKAPTKHEPCIPLSCCCVVAVTGADMLGKALGPATVHRWPLFSRITGADTGDKLNWSMLHRLIQHSEGAFKGTPPGCRRIWLLNQLSQNENLQQGELLISEAVDAIWAGSVQDSPAITRRRVRK